MKEDGRYVAYGYDPIIELFGPEHGGRTRTVSDVVGMTQVHGGEFRKYSAKEKGKNVAPERPEEASAAQGERLILQRASHQVENIAVDESPGRRVSSCASGGPQSEYSDIEVM